MENTNPKGSQKPNVKMIAIVLAVVVLAILVVVVISTNPKANTNNVNTNNNPVSGQEGDQPVNEVVSTTTASGQIIPEGSHVEVVGANPVKDNVVVTQTGTAVKNDAVPMSPEAPQQTAPISEKQLPSSAIKLGVSAAGFAPASFEVKAGAPVTLSVTATDTNTHVFMFDDASLAAVAIGVGPSETRAITFNAPSKAGEYTFRCDVPGHAGRGETGKMIVK